MPKNKPASILWIHQNFVTARQAGNSRAIHTIAALLEQGCNVDVITTQASYLEEALNSKKTDTIIEREKGLTIHRIDLGLTDAGYNNRTKSYISFVIKSIRYALTLPKPDCILCSSPPLLQVIPCILLSAIYKVPFIYEMRDIWPRILLETGLLKSKILGIGLRVIEATAFRYGNNCISVTPGFKEYCLSMGVEEKNSITVPTGGEPKLKTDKNLFRLRWRKHNGFENKRVALYSGSFNEHYGIKNLIESAISICQNNANVVFCFAGDGRDRDIVVNAAKAHDSIYYLGALSKDQLKTVFAGADFSLHTPSYYPMIKMMFSGKVFDYMAAGLPVISTVDGHTGMILKLSSGGVIADSPSQYHIGIAIQKLLDMPDTELDTMGNRAHDWLAKNMNVNSLARQNALFIITTCQQLKIKWGIIRLIYSFVFATIDGIRDRSSKAIYPLEHESDVLLSDAIKNYLLFERPAVDANAYALSIPIILSKPEDIDFSTI